MMKVVKMKLMTQFLLFLPLLCRHKNKQWLPSSETAEIRVILHSVALGVSKCIQRLLGLLA